MDIREILKQYDDMFARNTPDEIADFLAKNISLAESESDKPALLTLLNEQVGFARDRGRKEEALSGCSKLRALVDEMGLAGTVHYGKTLLNIANAYRAFGLYDESEELFNEIERLYVTILPEGSYDYAPLYNNWSLLAMDRGQMERACDLIKLSLGVIDRHAGAVINQATSRVNLACILMGLAGKETAPAGDRTDHLAEAESYIDEAVRLFESQGGDDYHYAAALSAKGDLMMKKHNYEEAINCYSGARRIVTMYLGENRKTQVLDDKIVAAKTMMADGK